MPISSYKDRLDALIAIAEGQEGYFSAAQAAEAGVDHLSLVRMARSGHLEREHWGVYRLTRWPIARHPGLWPAYLWGAAKGTLAFSHRTALQLHGVSDINPDKIDITFDASVRRIRGDVPPAVVLHSRPVGKSDIERIESLPVTTLRRTLLDLLVDNVARDAVSDVLTHGAQRGLLTSGDLRRLVPLYELEPEIRDYLVQNSRRRRSDSVHGLTPSKGNA